MKGEEMTDWNDYRRPIFRALEIYKDARTGEALADVLHHIDQFIETLAHESHIRPEPVSKIKAKLRANDLVGQMLDAKDEEHAWARLFDWAYRRVEEVVAVRTSGASEWQDSYAPTTETPELGLEEEAIVGTVAQTARARAVRVMPGLLAEFYDRRSRSESNVYRLIEASPATHRGLIALFCLLHPQAFEVFVEMEAGETLHLPDRKTLERAARNRRIAEGGQSAKVAAVSEGVAESSVFRIRQAERAKKHPRRGDPKTQRLLKELGRAFEMIRRAEMAAQLRKKK